MSISESYVSLDHQLISGRENHFFLFCGMIVKKSELTVVIKWTLRIILYIIFSKDMLSLDAGPALLKFSKEWQQRSRRR